MVPVKKTKAPKDLRSYGLLSPSRRRTLVALGRGCRELVLVHRHPDVDLEVTGGNGDQVISTEPGAVQDAVCCPLGTPSAPEWPTPLSGESRERR